MAVGHRAHSGSYARAHCLWQDVSRVVHRVPSHRQARGTCHGKFSEDSQRLTVERNQDFVLDFAIQIARLPILGAFWIPTWRCVFITWL